MNAGDNLEFELSTQLSLDPTPHRSTNSPGMEGTCPHFAPILEQYKSSNSGPLKKFVSVSNWRTVRLDGSVRHAAKRRKLPTPSCDTCGIPLTRPLACLHCNFAGCWNPKHAVMHLRQSNHLLCTDVHSGRIFCSACNDFIFDTTLDSLHLQAVISATEKLSKLQTTTKPREPYKSWKPSAKEAEILSKSTAIACQKRRGLLNLGQTCFLNVVLQSFVHNPLLRNFFLSDKHNHRTCKINNCTCCEMDKLFAEIYSDDSSPYGPVDFLLTTWRAQADLAGYSQQDAHEFFISTLNQIHTTSRGSTNISCICVIHSTFAGSLQSDVKCEKCGNINSTVDPMLDISLELRGDDTLASCLRRFTTPESLGVKDYNCEKCGKASHDASKRLSFHKLPAVLSFQFKRFEADKTSANKIDTPVRFPASINMAPYTSLAMKDNLPSHALGPESAYEYDLFAVINHEGQLNNGHYTNFARFGDEWYRFDDDKVTQSSLIACLNSTAYMCFYVKRNLEYKPYTTPTYIQKREADIVKEREMEEERKKKRMREVEDALLATV